MSAAIDEKVAQIRAAIYGEEVREAIASAIEEMDEVAEGAQDSATASAQQAEEAKDDAEDARDAAAASKDAAQAAQTAAEGAKTDAQAAQTAAEAAKTAAEGSASTATSAKNDAVAAKNAAVSAASDAEDAAASMLLIMTEIPDTVQTCVFADGAISRIEHKRSGSNVRVDAFTFGDNTITEVRTLSTGESLTIVTNLTTLETTVTYAAA